MTYLNKEGLSRFEDLEEMEMNLLAAICIAQQAQCVAQEQFYTMGVDPMRRDTHPMCHAGKFQHSLPSNASFSPHNFSFAHSCSLNIQMSLER